MKKSSVFVMLFISINSFSQVQYDKETKLLKAEKIIQVDSMPKQAIFNKTKAWFGQNFNNAKQVITSEVPEEGVITGRYLNTYRIGGVAQSFNNTITVSIKDNKLKAIISNIVHENGNSLETYIVKKDGTFPREMYKKPLDDVNADVTKTLASLEAYLKKSSDW